MANEQVLTHEQWKELDGLDLLISVTEPTAGTFQIWGEDDEENDYLLAEWDE